MQGLYADLGKLKSFIVDIQVIPPPITKNNTLFIL